MSGGNYGWIEIIFIAVIALGIGGWQLWSVNREIKKDKENAAPPKPIDLK